MKDSPVLGYQTSFQIGIDIPRLDEVALINDKEEGDGSNLLACAFLESLSFFQRRSSRAIRHQEIARGTLKV